MTKKFSLLLIICVLKALNINAEIYEGSCGSNVRYSLDTETGLLSITGTGAMTNYSSNISVPWCSKWSYIKTVDIADGVTYIGQYAFSGCCGLASITIPNSVTSIKDYAFSYCSGLTSIEIPNSVTSIGGRAFYGCYGLTSVTIPNSVTSIGSDAFQGCTNLTKVELNNNAITSKTYSSSSTIGNIFGSQVKEYIIGDSVTSIGYSAFYGCSGLTSITIGNSVTSIGSYAFYNCSGLISIEIPNSVTSIGAKAFSYCSGLTSINIPNSVTSIGENAFYGTAWYSNQPDGLVYAGKVAYKYKGTMPENTTISIKEGTLGIAGSAFYECSNLTSVEIPNSVTSIGSYAFSGCYFYKQDFINNSSLDAEMNNYWGANIADSKEDGFYIKDGVLLKYRGKEASVTIPNSVTSIGSDAFYGCSGLTSVTIPNSVTSIGEGAFSDCSSLTKVTINSNAITSKTYSSSSTIGKIFGSQVKEYILGDDVTSIGNYVFYNCSGLTSINIPNSVTSIGEDAFYGCSGLTSITIGNSVTSIGISAFSGCSGLTSVTIPNSVTSIGYYAFRGCSGLISIEIPNSVTSIRESTFSGCSGLTSVTIPNSVTSIREDAFYGTAWYSNQPNGLVYAGKVAYKYKGTMPKNTTISIEEGTLGIAGYAFNNCSNLTSVEIPNSVTSIGENAFYGTAWYSNQPDGLVYAGKVAYRYKGTMPENTTISIKEGTLGIAGSAFRYCSNLTSVEIPNSMTSIGYYAFYGCSKLTEIYCNAENVPTTSTDAFTNANISNATLYVPAASVAAYMAVYPWSKFGTVKTRGSEIDYGSCGTNVRYSLDTGTGVLSITGTGAMTNYSSSSNVPWYNKKSYIKTVEITNGITSIGNYAIYNCDSLESVTIPNSVTSIGSYAFYGCSGLESVTIPNNVTSIGSSAFYGCFGLTSIEIPSSVTSIGSSAFSGCAGELIVNCNIRSASQSTNGAFYASKFKSVTIGESVTSIGDYAFYDCDSLVSVTVPNSVTSIGSSAFSSCEVLTRVSINSNSIVSTGDYSLCSIFGSQVKEYIIGKDVTSIWAGKFSDCTDLAYITIPTSVKSIGNSAFRNCPKLESVAIPNSVTSIGEYALSDCANLKSVTIGSGVQVIGKDVFENHHPSKVFWLTNTPPEGYAYAEGSINYVSNTRYTELSNVIRYSSLSSIFEVDGIRYVPVNPSARTCDAIDCTYDESVDSINIGEKVTYMGIALSVKQVSPYTCYGNKHIKDINLSFKGDIGAKAFYGCSNMTTAELGNGILSIGESCFSNCSKLESIVIPDSVVAINDSTFCDCIVLNSAKIGRGVKSIGRYAFSGCSVLPNIRIPQNVTSVADYAFRGCENIKTVVMEDGDSELSLSSNGSNPLFVDCPLDSVYIGRNILYETSAEYGYSPFYHNETLRTVVITDKETEISDNEFYSCTNLQSFKIGDGVTRFGNWAFSGCSSLKSLGFGTELQSIGQEAFSDCSAVTVIVSRTEIPPVCESQALEDINKWECTLYVPEGTSPDYQEADQWKDFWYMEEGAPYVVIRGDVNGDEFVNMKDAIFVTNIILGLEDATEAADVNNDGKINMQDVMFIVNYIKKGKFPDE